MSVFMLQYLVSCVTQSNTSRFSPVYLTDRARFYLLPAAEIDKPLDCVQQITVSYGGQEYIMDAWVRADENGIEMALWTALGMSIGDFSFSDLELSLNTPVFPSSFKAEYMAADFQLCYFRPKALQKALGDIGLSFAIENNQSSDEMMTEIRRISDAGKIIIEIEKAGNYLRYTNFLRGYGWILRGAE